MCAFQVYIDTVGDPGKYEIMLSKHFPSIKFVVAKKADSLYPVVSGASIVAKVLISLFMITYVAKSGDSQAMAFLIFIF